MTRPSSDEEGQPRAKPAAGRLTGLAASVENRDRPSSDEEGQPRARERRSRDVRGAGWCDRGVVPSRVYHPQPLLFCSADLRFRGGLEPSHSGFLLTCLRAYTPTCLSASPHLHRVKRCKTGCLRGILPGSPTLACALVFVIVAIDGPAGSGKSTTARRVAARLGWLYLDSGAMYRAVGLAFAGAGLPYTDEAAARLMPRTTVDLVPDPAGTRVLLDGADVTDRIRTPEAADAASRVSALGPVRDAMVAAQRRIADRLGADGSGVVVEGRDIGTVVFPGAEVKVFMEADLTARAARRHAELAAHNPDAPSVEVVTAEIAARDGRDRDRVLAPLRPAADAVALDTTALSVEEQVERVLALVHARQAAA